MDNTNTPHILSAFRKSKLLVFGVLWVVVFLVYLKASQGGWVSDDVELLYRLRHGSFWDFINAKLSRGNLYHFSWTAFYIAYSLFHLHTFLWYMLFVSFHAANATLIYSICTRLFEKSGVKHSVAIAGGGTLLFCICPHISEVLIWKAAFHYLHSMFNMLCVVYCVQKFFDTSKSKYAWIAGIIFLISSFSHEFFYLTPFFVLTTVLYYRYVLGYERAVFNKAIRWFFLPLCAIIIVHQLLLLVNTGTFTYRLEAETQQSGINFFRKPPLYFFHTIFFGRFFPYDSTRWVYAFFSSPMGIAAFYGIALISLIIIVMRFRQMENRNKIFILICCWMGACIALVCPMWLPDNMLILFDRYTYYMLPFIYILLMFLLVHLPRRIAVGIFAIYAFINVYFTNQVATYWQYSAHLTNKLEHALPPCGDKTVLLLNLPEYMNGAPVLGPWWHFSFKQTYNLLNEQQINNPMYDVVSYNMISPTDGAHVMVVNDSTIHVTLNQFGTWWWANLTGAYSYSNNDYRFNLIDPGHWYELTLRHPAAQYVLLYEAGDQWKVVDMNKNGKDQY